MSESLAKMRPHLITYLRAVVRHGLASYRLASLLVTLAVNFVTVVLALLLGRALGASWLLVAPLSLLLSLAVIFVFIAPFQAWREAAKSSNAPISISLEHKSPWIFIDGGETRCHAQIEVTNSGEIAIVGCQVSIKSIEIDDNAGHDQFTLDYPLTIPASMVRADLRFAPQRIAPKSSLFFSFARTKPSRGHLIIDAEMLPTTFKPEQLRVENSYTFNLAITGDSFAKRAKVRVHLRDSDWRSLEADLLDVSDAV